ncbi:MAG: efflux RND transporter periplasmic adaptor subunit [Terriglobales bacterium]
MRNAILSLLLASSAGLWTGCRHAHSSPVSAGAPVGLRAVTAALVRSARPRLRVLLPAELAPYQDATLQARVPGFIQTLYVDRGSRVHTGQLLAVLDAPDLSAKRAQAVHQLASARALHLEAQATLQRDQATLERLRGAAAAEAGAVAGNDIQIAEHAVAAGQAEVEARQAAEQAAAANLASQTALSGYLRVLAPFDGVIIRRDASVGGLAGPSAPALFELQQIDPLRLTVDVPEADAVGIPIGVRLPFTVASQPGRSFPGVVARIAHSVRRDTRSMPIELDVPNPGLVLAPGMFARVAWSFQRAQPSLFVPATAVVRGSERTLVERIGADLRLQWVDVTTGFTDGDNIEVFGALHPGDRVVAAADDDLRPGQTVTVTPASSAASPHLEP